MNNTAKHRQDRHDNARHTGSGNEMADDALRPRHSQLVSVIAEHFLNGQSLDAIVDLGAGGVSVDVLDSFGDRPESASAKRMHAIAPRPSS